MTFKIRNSKQHHDSLERVRDDNPNLTTNIKHGSRIMTFKIRNSEHHYDLLDRIRNDEINKKNNINKARLN